MEEMNKAQEVLEENTDTNIVEEKETEKIEEVVTENSIETPVEISQAENEEPLDKMIIVSKYQKALITAINSIKDDVTATTQIKESSDSINSYHTLKKVLNNLQRKISKLEPLDSSDYGVLTMVCYLNAEKMVSYGQQILDHAKIVADLSKIFSHE